MTIKYNPLYSSEYTFKDSIENLQKVSIKDVALQFSIDSLKQMGTYGFVKIDVSFGDYTKKLLSIVEKLEISVLGSLTFRPKIIYKGIENNHHYCDNYDLIYLKLLNEKNIKKIRFVILSDFEVLGILNDANDQLEKNPKLTLTKIPEIQWFKDQASKKCDVYWVSQDMFYDQFIRDANGIREIISFPGTDKSVTDFAVFDSNLLITWRTNMRQMQIR